MNTVQVEVQNGTGVLHAPVHELTAAVQKGGENVIHAVHNNPLNDTFVVQNFKENNTVATRTRKTVVQNKSASDQMREMFDNGMTVKEVAKVLNKNYAFVYGVAKRYGKVLELAARKTTRPVTNDGENVQIRVLNNSKLIIVNLATGKVTSKAIKN